MKNIIFLFSILTLLIACNNSKIREVKLYKDNNKRIESAIWKIIDKYNLIYSDYYDDKKDTINILNHYLLDKTITFPEGITVEFRRYFDCHKHIELIIFYDSISISVIPFYGTSFYEKHIKKKSNNYITAFASELNTTYNCVNKNLMKRNEVNFRNKIFFRSYFNSIFKERNSFVGFVMKEIDMFPIEKIENLCVLEKNKSFINRIDFKAWGIQISKEQALKNLNQIDKANCDLYGVFYNMILKFEYKGDSILVSTINQELFKEIIF